MKKHLLFLLLLLPLAANAYDAGVNGIYYNLSRTTAEAEVTRSGSYYSGNIVIPSSITYNGKTYSVTSIGKTAFWGCTGLTSITIPNSVTSIGDGSFYGCTGLTEVEIPNSVTTIGENAFYGCTGLTSISIPNSVTTIEIDAFRNCVSLSSINLPNSIKKIGRGAFSGCTGLPVEYNIRYAGTCAVEIIDKSVTSCSIKDGTTWIGPECFKSCKNLTSIEIPNTVDFFGGEAFDGCI